MGDNSSASVPPEAGSDSPSLLWVPYLSLTIVLLLMTLASFVNYHFKNRERYRNEKAQKEGRDIQMNQPNYAVTPPAALRDKNKQRLIKQSIDSNSTATTSLDSRDSQVLGAEQFSNHFLAYQNAAFTRSDQSLDHVHEPAVSSVQDEIAFSESQKQYGAQHSGSSQPHAMGAGTSSEGRPSREHLYTYPPVPEGQHIERDKRDSGSSYWDMSSNRGSPMVTPPNGMSSPRFKVYLLDNMTLHLASLDKHIHTNYPREIHSDRQFSPMDNSLKHPNLDAQISNETQSTYLSVEEDGDESRESASISSHSTYV